MNKNKGVRLWSVIFWLLLWQLAGQMIGNSIFFVTPFTVLIRLTELTVQPLFWRAILYSLTRISFGFVIGCVFGASLAVVSSRHPIIEQLLAPPMLLIRTVPVVSFIILALICFSSKNLSILISFLMVLPIVYTNTLQGFQNLDPALEEMADVFQVPVVRRFRYIRLNQVMPFFLAGYRIAVGLCWKAGIAAEVIGIPSGSIGERMQQAKIYLETPDLFAWTAVIILLCFFFEKVSLFLLAAIANKLEEI